jgi:hypothetical protein
MASGKASVSRPRKRLIEMMQEVNFGRIERLTIQGREPVYDPASRIVREIKFGGENGARPELQAEDFLLKSQVLELFGFLDKFCDGVIDVIEIKHGLPFRIIVSEVAA